MPKVAFASTIIKLDIAFNKVSTVLIAKESPKITIIIDQNSVLESLISLKRAGASAIVSYYADRINNLIK